MASPKDRAKGIPPIHTDSNGRASTVGRQRFLKAVIEARPLREWRLGCNKIAGRLLVSEGLVALLDDQRINRTRWWVSSFSPSFPESQ